MRFSLTVRDHRAGTIIHKSIFIDNFEKISVNLVLLYHRYVDIYRSSINIDIFLYSSTVHRLIIKIAIEFSVFL